MLHSIRRALTIRTLWHLSHVSISFQSKVMPKKKRVLALWRHNLTGSWYLICNYLQKNQAFPDRKNEANRMVYVIKVHSCAKFVVFLHVWFGVTKSMVSLDRFLLRSGYLTSTDVLHVFVNGISSWHRKDSSGIIFMTLAKWVQMKLEGQLSP